MAEAHIRLRADNTLRRSVRKDTGRNILTRPGFRPSGDNRSPEPARCCSVPAETDCKAVMRSSRRPADNRLPPEGIPAPVPARRPGNRSAHIRMNRRSPEQDTPAGNRLPDPDIRPVARPDKYFYFEVHNRSVSCEFPSRPHAAFSSLYA